MTETTMASCKVPPADTSAFYRAAWRWHFYAGLYVIPFFIMLAITGMAMLWIAYLDGRDGELTAVTPQPIVSAVSAQASAAVAAVPEGELVQYIAPRSAELAAIFRVDQGEDAIMVVVNPYTAQVLEQFPRRSGWYDFMDNLHGSLLLGVTGDRMIEIAASLGMIIVTTGLYLWWPRQGSVMAALVPNVRAKGRAWWRSMRAVCGVWLSVFLVLFLLSGLAWAGIWGAKFVQAWSSFPAGKYNNIPVSELTHGSMNHDRKEVPWALELTPLPASGSLGGEQGIAEGLPVTMDVVDAFAREIGFDGRYKLSLPKGESGVWSLSRDSMGTDSQDPTSDRIVHIDRYSGNVLADVRYQDYSLAGKAMAVGIALHMGTLGLWSVLANTLICLSVIFLCVSGVVMWWKRRPAGVGLLGAPPAPAHMPHWRGATAIGLVLCLAFPLAGITLAVVLLLDVLIGSRLGARQPVAT